MNNEMEPGISGCGSLRVARAHRVELPFGDELGLAKLDGASFHHLMGLVSPS